MIIIMMIIEVNEDNVLVNIIDALITTYNSLFFISTNATFLCMIPVHVSLVI